MAIKELEKNLSADDIANAKLAAENQLGEKLKNIDNIYKEDM